MRKADRDSVEMLFVAGSSRDRKGERVIVREGEVENYLWPGQEIDTADLRLMGINAHQEKQIAAFLGKRQSPGSSESFSRRSTDESKYKRGNNRPSSSQGPG